MPRLFGDVYRDKRVLVTGHAGFKGSWSSTWLHELGAKVAGYALEPETERDNFVVSGLDEKADHRLVQGNEGGANGYQLAQEQINYYCALINRLAPTVGCTNSRLV